MLFVQVIRTQPTSPFDGAQFGDASSDCDFLHLRVQSYEMLWIHAKARSREEKEHEILGG
ncbi:MAG TPA: hypothetical protein VMF06_24620 [Candidatus Limnocylindria bacterium]|jgi:hypothetical protein|nr:hypothetical protein [Candidatus Limnocylindria bacterium]